MGFWREPVTKDFLAGIIVGAWSMTLFVIITAMLR